MSVCHELMPPSAPGALPEHCQGTPNDFGWCPEHFRCTFEDAEGHRCERNRELPFRTCPTHRTA